MTEEEWLAEETSLVGYDPTSSLPDPLSDRKLFLLYAASLPRLMLDRMCPACLELLPLFEEQADGKATTTEWARASKANHPSTPSGRECPTKDVFRQVRIYLRGITTLQEFWNQVVDIHFGVQHEIGWETQLRLRRGEHIDPNWHRALRATAIGVWREGMWFLRELIGNPFRPVVVDPEWRTPTVTQLARGIYDNRNFNDLPILADALQDAGCDCDDILNHFRDPNATHVRGCWALDLVLGKQ